MVDYFKQCCKKVKKLLNSSMPLMKIQHLASVHYGFKSFNDLKDHAENLCMTHVPLIDCTIIKEVIENA